MSVATSIELENYPAKAGETKPRVNRYIKDGQLKVAPAGINNVVESYLDAMKRHGENKEIVGYRPALDDKGNFGPYTWLTYKQFHTRFSNFGSGIINNGMKQGDHIGVFSKNRTEWLITEFGSLSFDVYPIPLYDTLGSEAIVHIVHEAELSVIACSSDRAEFLLTIADQINDVVKKLIVMDNITEELAKKSKSCGIDLLSFTDVEKSGSDSPVDFVTKAGLDSNLTICYTSGTTGMPKGVVLVQKNFLSAIESLNFFIDTKQIESINNTDSYLSFLPLAHILERFLIHMLISRGCQIGFSRGNVAKIVEDIYDLKPSIFVGVPRLFSRIKDKVYGEIEKKGGIAAALFKYAFGVKKNYIPSGENKHWIWDRLVFSKVKEKLGGRIKLIVSGSAPISAESLDFMRICFSSEVHEGYGSTETTGACSLTTNTDVDSGTVGTPFPNAMIKLVDVPELGYLSTDKPFPRGEVCVAGSGIFKEYYKSPEKTAETLDADGFCHTGDIGLFDNLGRLKIIDRKKNLFKLSQGEYVAPEKVENVYVDNPIVSQAFIYGNSLKSYLVGVIVPDPELLIKFLKSAKIEGYTYNKDEPLVDICKNVGVRKAVVKNLSAWGRSRDLKGFENVRNIYIESNPFEVGAILSPTLKLKRNEARVYYQEILDGLYVETGDL
ncbi:Long chain acyl-CoA synthetase 7, peroxisomal [Smittium mucronatum]|uniref:Long chain acyl-CoA synthetase 7, peroxisomal n=1 Tax=Smittium mucronatum TaxID=133383 RepID=A0A1R0H3H7_9FUNG|nr:Long chain acyl-CoA synthetase 7, peroxisomal [Smittium mucronatum]